MIISSGVGWMSLPIVVCAEVLLSRMLSNASSDEARAGVIEWLGEVPDEMLSAEELEKREDDQLLRMLGMER
jgi:hypothetical protein